ncbi:DUF4019 domain-containing protein [Polaromonas sp. YR568]|uniref:DUF4019 domain-containing protein n=1 Tax=Polaromonas sp. YR568 TaxID=1855301 RepID=UPI00398BEA8E
MKNAKHGGLKNSWALQLWALLMALGLSFGAAAQGTSSADAAIAVAEQWLALADADQGGAMWDQSFPFMKEKIDRASWINHVTTKTNTLGRRTASRVWAGMEHDIDKPGLPPGEFASVLFVAPYAKSRGWERVAIYWNKDRWVPVGYVYGAGQPGAQPSAK